MTSHQITPWNTPRLTVLVRNKDQHERVLDMCKIFNASDTSYMADWGYCSPNDPYICAQYNEQTNS